MRQMHKLGKEQGINVQGIDVRLQLAGVYAVPLLGEGLPPKLGDLGYSKIASRHLFPQSTYTSQGGILFFFNIPAMEKKFEYRAESISAQRSGMLTQFLLEKVSEECSPISRKIGAVVLSGTSENSGCGTKERFVEKY